MYKIKKYTSFNIEIKKYWKELELNSDNYVFQSYNWLKHWYDQIGSKKENLYPIIFLVIKDDFPVSLFPFQLREINNFKVLEFLGNDQNDLNTFLYDTRLTLEQIKEIWKFIKQEFKVFDAISLERVPNKLNENNNAMLKLINNLDFISKNYFVDLKDDWEHIKNSFPKKMVKENTRKEKKLSANGTLTYSNFFDIEKSKRVIDKTLILKEKKYKKTGVRNILKSKIIRNFYNKIKNIENNKIKIHISALEFNNDILATHIGISYKKRFYYLFPVFDDEYSYYSPGRILMQKELIKSIKEGNKIFDYLAGEEDYKKKWSNNHMNIYSYYQHNNIRGKMYIWFVKFKLTIKTNRYSKYVITGFLKILYKLNNG